MKETSLKPVIEKLENLFSKFNEKFYNNELQTPIIKVENITADESVMKDGKLDISLVNTIAFDPYTNGYYKMSERVGEAFRDGLKLKK